MRICLFLLFLVAPVATHAASPLGKVGTAIVKEGNRAVEGRVAYTRDHNNRTTDRRWQSLQLLDYSFNDTQAMRLITAQDKLHRDNVEHAAVSFEYWHQFIERRDHGWDGAVRLTYTHRDHDKRPSAAGIRFMAQGPLTNGWRWGQNLIFNRTIGAGQLSSFSFESRSTLIRTMSVTPDDFIKSWQLGAEIFNDFGRFNALHGYSEQDHQLGPVVNIAFARGVNIQTGYRFGISKAAANHSYKLFTSIPF